MSNTYVIVLPAAMIQKVTVLKPSDCDSLRRTECMRMQSESMAH